MLIWNCQGCPYPTKTHHAGRHNVTSDAKLVSKPLPFLKSFSDVELSGPSGKVGNLVVTHMIPEGGVGQNVEIEVFFS